MGTRLRVMVAGAHGGCAPRNVVPVEHSLPVKVQAEVKQFLFRSCFSSVKAPQGMQTRHDFVFSWSLLRSSFRVLLVRTRTYRSFSLSLSLGFPSGRWHACIAWHGKGTETAVENDEVTTEYATRSLEPYCCVLIGCWFVCAVSFFFVFFLSTGKTDVAVQTISNLYHSFPNQRTIMVAHSNAALNDLFEKIMEK